MKQIMLDLETLGTGSNAVIVSISAVHFDMETGEIGAKFEAGLNLNQQKANIDGDTVMWWLQQSKSAQKELTSLQPQEVHSALQEFNSFLKFTDARSLWGNSSTFDCVILRNLYDRIGIQFHLPFWADRCVRTWVEAKGIDKKLTPFKGVPHKGIDDCLHQIEYCTKGKTYEIS